MGRGSAHRILINAHKNEMEMQVVALSHFAYVVQISKVLVILHAICILRLCLAVRIIRLLVRVVWIKFICLLYFWSTVLLFFGFSWKLLKSRWMSLLRALLDSKVFLGAECIVICLAEARMISASVGLHTADLVHALAHIPSNVNLRIGFLDWLMGPA